MRLLLGGLFQAFLKIISFSFANCFVSIQLTPVLRENGGKCKGTPEDIEDLFRKQNGSAHPPPFLGKCLLVPQALLRVSWVLAGVQEAVHGALL